MGGKRFERVEREGRSHGISGQTHDFTDEMPDPPPGGDNHDEVIEDRTGESLFERPW
jgi:hypothetical protein